MGEEREGEGEELGVDVEEEAVEVLQGEYGGDGGEGEGFAVGFFLALPFRGFLRLAIEGEEGRGRV